MNQLLAQITWSPSIGDPNVLGWTIAITYVVAGVLCMNTGFQRKKFSTASDQPTHLWIWFALGFLMIALGLNKQLDIHKLLTEIGREIVKNHGWRAQRKNIQTAFVLGLACVGLILVVGKLYLIRNRLREFGLALIGLMSLLAFTIFRAASLYRLGNLVNRLPYYGDEMNAGLELGGAFLVALGALFASHGTSGTSPRSKTI